jgi:hypothetical protein
MRFPVSALKLVDLDLLTAFLRLGGTNCIRGPFSSHAD